jgi:hypothetical protein
MISDIVQVMKIEKLGYIQINILMYDIRHSSSDENRKARIYTN